jgi:hypothetical protein
MGGCPTQSTSEGRDATVPCSAHPIDRCDVGGSRPDLKREDVLCDLLPSQNLPGLLLQFIHCGLPSPACRLSPGNTSTSESCLCLSVLSVLLWGSVGFVYLCFPYLGLSCLMNCQQLQHASSTPFSCKLEQASAIVHIQYADYLNIN